MPKVESIIPSMTRQGFVTALQDKVTESTPLYLYQEYFSSHSASMVTVTQFHDDGQCSNIKDDAKCRDYVLAGSCSTSEFVLTNCQFSCGACRSMWGSVPIPAHTDDVLSGFTLNVAAADQSTPIYLRQICILKEGSNPDLPTMDDSYLVTVLDPVIVGNEIEVEVRSMTNRFGWTSALTLFYVVDRAEPTTTTIPFDHNVVNHTLFRRGGARYLKHESIIPVPSGLFSEDQPFGLLRIAVTSWNGDCGDDGSGGSGDGETLNEWMYSADSAGSGSGGGLGDAECFGSGSMSWSFWALLIGAEPSISGLRASAQSASMGLFHGEMPCSRLFVDYDRYDRWLVESLSPSPFDLAVSPWYSVLDENPQNELGEVHIEMECGGSLRWFVQIGIGGEWAEWIVSGQSKLEGSGRSMVSHFDAESGSVRQHEVRRYDVRVADPEQFVVSEDERVPTVLQIAVRVEWTEPEAEGQGLALSDTFYLTATRVPDHETLTPIVMAPRHGEVVPTGLTVSYLIPEDVLSGSLKLRILPRGSAKFETDSAGIRTVTFRGGSDAERSRTAHSVKLCPSLGAEGCLAVTDGMGLGVIVEAVFPAADLLPHSLYDVILQYNDRWGNPHGHRRVNHLMAVRDWTEDLVVLRALSHDLRGDHWFIAWPPDDDAFCGGAWYGVECNALGHIVALRLFANNLEGALPAAIGKLSTLKVLDLSANYITGAVPAELQLLTVIESISFAANSLTGSIPNGIEKLRDLRTLNLAGNMLSGTVPQGLVVAANTANLRHIELNGNRLSGFIPDQLADAADLELLFLADNDWWCPQYDVPTNYAQWATVTDHSSADRCRPPPADQIRNDIKSPHDLLIRHNLAAAAKDTGTE